jgi:hypothetical protein
MMANVITGIRILVSAALLLCPVVSPIFYAMYLIAGLSDIIVPLIYTGIPICSVATFAAVQEGHLSG